MGGEEILSDWNEKFAFDWLYNDHDHDKTLLYFEDNDQSSTLHGIEARECTVRIKEEFMVSVPSDLVDISLAIDVHW